MERPQLLELITSELRRTAPELQDVDMTAASLLREDLGVTSLDVYEVVASSMKRLRIKVDRDGLDVLKTIDDIADLLLATLQEQALQNASV